MLHHADCSLQRNNACISTNHIYIYIYIYIYDTYYLLIIHHTTNNDQNDVSHSVEEAFLLPSFFFFFLDGAAGTENNFSLLSKSCRPANPKLAKNGIN